MKNNILLTIIIPLIMISCRSGNKLETVPSVDLKRYAGVWYEIALYPVVFEKGCNCTTAEYIPTDKNYVKVINRCRKGGINGKESMIEGKAFIEKGSNNAKLKVQFFWPFKGKYWIIGLADDYSWAVVSHPNRKYLWILSRTPQLQDGVYEKIIQLIKEKGLDPEKLIKTTQIKA